MESQWGLWLVVLLVAGLIHVRVKASIYDEFKVNWCKQRRWRIDWEALLKPCQNLAYQNNAGEQEERFKTSTVQSEILDIQQRPAGEYSRFFVQSRTQSGRRKTNGGDSWRVYLEGPSHLAGTVFDHNNGVYEVLFLIMEPGIYKINMILDYSLCKGLMDPPIDWFKNAHCSGKFKNVHLSDKLFSEMTGYINKPLLFAQNRRLVIPPARVSQIEIQNNMRAADKECDIQCDLMWDGFGRWIQLTGTPNRTQMIWRPYINSTEQDSTYLRSIQKHHHHLNGQGVFWVYGDSLSYYFYKSIANPPRRICLGIFRECNCSYNWLYPKTLYELTETCSEISLNISKVLNFFRDVISRKDMNDQSALLLNVGAHYVKTTNFQSYQDVIKALASEIKRLYNGKAIWKSTTAIHGQTADIMGAFRRFTTNHRIQLYNAYANSVMCKNSISALDVYPLTDSYPKGTRDGIHYENTVFESVIKLLERYFTTH